MANRSFTWWCGLALATAAVLIVGVNVALTPRLPRGSFDALAASDVFMVRQSLASATALLMLFGIIGLHVSRLPRPGLFANVAFVVAIVGAAGLFATEWNQLFTIRDFALYAPVALNAVEDAGDLTPFDIGALVATTTFFGGWLLLAISLALSGQYSRLSAGLVAAGFVVAPALSATGVSGPLAVIAASAVIGAGWLLLALQLMRRPAAP